MKKEEVKAKDKKNREEILVDYKSWVIAIPVVIVVALILITFYIV